MNSKNALLLTSALILLVMFTVNKSFAVDSSVDNSDKAAVKKQSYRASKKVPAMRNRVYAQLARAQQLADEGDKIEGFAVLAEVEDRLDSLNSYERAMLFNFYGFMYYGNDDIDLAVDSFNRVIAETAIPDSLIISTLYSLAQLSMQQQNYKEAFAYLTQWRKSNAKELTANQEMLFAQVLYQDKNFVSSLKHIERAINLVEVKNKLPKENWLTLQRASYYELKQPRQVTKVMEKLVRLYDKPQYWLQLASMYGEIAEEDKQMAVMEAAYQAGYIIKSADVLTLSQLYLFHGAPYKSARILEQAIAKGSVFADKYNLSTLARAYLAAKENNKAIKVLIRISAIAQSGESDALLAQTYLNTEQWQQAISSSKLALARYAEYKKGKVNKVKEIANMHLIQGMANFNLKHFESSLVSFAKASKFISTKKTALQWGKYVEREQQHYKVQLAMLN
ncbi:tetratricopeptide repeat protein [Colwellia psychrerythraea]|uniref:TPR domain protein n=1 Tax=Colwellia psychrerythraea TaxID=28229 RepID=A0A099KEI8_COLPS|nr:hypothetical protein [Colwellia psychrerythraea]KGJ89149.1 hypothetical protein GAB14E_4145 [Colwellia psychrerythraea]